MGRWLLPRGPRPVAARVVLYYRSEGPQTKAATLIPPGTSTLNDVVGQPRAQLGAVRRRAFIAGPDSRSPGEGDQSDCGDAGYANQASSALQTSSSPSMGVQPGGTTSSPTFSWHDARGDVQIVLRTTSSVSGFYGGRRSELQSSGYSCKLPCARTHHPFLYHNITLKRVLLET